MIRRGMAVLLSFCIAFPPAICSAATAAVAPVLNRSLAPKLPTPGLRKVSASQLKLTFVPKTNVAASLLNTSTSASTAATTAAALTTAATAAAPVASASKTSSTASSDVLPTYTNLGTGIASITQPASNKMVITQDQSLAIQNWNTFNIGANDWVQFDQGGNQSWVCLNRIYDQNPSMIYGKLTADGKIYLINQNGILFENGSQVNVYGLIASSLNLTASDSDFLNGTASLDFQAQDYQQSGATKYLDASVINKGSITTGTAGSALLIGPYVKNDGMVQTTAGQVGLVAADDVQFSQNLNIRNPLIVDVTGEASGTSANDGYAVNNGTLYANTGLIGMYGTNIEQNSLAEAITSLEVTGQIELLASGKVYLAPGSTTETPVTTSDYTADQSFNPTYSGGTINIFGLASDDTLSRDASAQTIDIEGHILDNSGTVTIQAVNDVTLGNSAVIDVSGLQIDEPASANTTQLQLNSVQLADYPDQKGGILQGATITVNNLTGSTIGNISGALTSQQETAQQRSLRGGTIDIISQSGNVNVNQGASINFSGGTTTYETGNITTTALISGNEIYDISNAPDTLDYTAITTITTHVASYVEGADAGTLALLGRKVVLDGSIQGSATNGVYQTGMSELLDKMGNQKTLGLEMAAGGTLMIGLGPDTALSYMSNVSSGVEAFLQDFMVNSVVLYGSGDQIDETGDSSVTYLSAQKLSSAGLSNLQISANTTLEVMPDADISLATGVWRDINGNLHHESVSLAARDIELAGEILAPSGTVGLEVTDDVTADPANSLYQLMPFSNIDLESGSVIDASGRRVDNSPAANSGSGGVDSLAFIAGGSVSIKDLSYSQEAQGVSLAAGSLVDINGGYGISSSGAVTGANAGSLTVQGAAILLDGVLEGWSIQGYNGGSIALYADSIRVSPSSNPDENLADSDLVLDPDALNNLTNSGLTSISLESVNDISIEQGVNLSPSLWKLATPVPGGDHSVNSLVQVAQDFIGSSSFSASAGVPFTTVDANGAPVISNPSAVVDLAATSNLSVGPQGKISLSGPSISIDGTLDAPAGTIKIAASNSIELGGQIYAQGYNLQAAKSVAYDLPVGYTALAAGTVTLSALNITTAAGSGIDVSGSSPVVTWLLDANGAPVEETVASNPGSVVFSGIALDLNGALEAKSLMTGLAGGSLSITDKDTANYYTLTDADIQSYLSGGFDVLSFASYKGLAFSGPVNVTVSRDLTLDAPSIVYTGTVADSINLSSPSILLADSYSYGYVAGQAPSSGSAQLTLTGQSIDVSGSVLLSGFGKVNLSATKDITLSEFDYTGTSGWAGQLLTAGDLLLQAERIYPAMVPITTQSGSSSTIPGYIPSDFTIDAGGLITIESTGSNNSTPIYSAGGSLTIDSEGEGIDMEGGTVAAPLGQITLSAPNGRVYLASGATLTTAGSIPISYWMLDSTGTFWNNPNDSTDILATAPQESITLSGVQVITRSGSTIDASGGGSVFAYQFLPDVEGTVNPLLGKYVIVPGADYSVPASQAAGYGLQAGESIYLSGVPGLKDGEYTVLPEQYAFLPGAMIVTPTGQTVVQGTERTSADGFPIAAGYLTYQTSQGTYTQPSVMQGFEVQSASYVLSLGHFITQNYVGGNGGAITISGSTTVVDGQIAAKPLAGYLGGSLTLGGTNAYEYLQSQGILPANFGFTTDVSSAGVTSGNLDVVANTLSGFNTVTIGNISGGTQTVTMEAGAVLDATQVNLNALNSITLDSNAQINTSATSYNTSSGPQTQPGGVVLYTPSGLLDMEPGSSIASDNITMTIGQMGRLADAQGDIQEGFWGSLSDNGSLDLVGQNVYFEPEGYSAPQQQPGDPSSLYVPYSFWSRFGSISEVTVAATGGSNSGYSLGTVGFSGDFTGASTLCALQSFTVDAAVIDGAGNNVAIAAPSIYLLNRGGTAVAASLATGGSLTLEANEIYVGEGSLLSANVNALDQWGLLLSGFGALNFNARNDITFLGAGAVPASGSQGYAFAVGGAFNLKSACLTTSYYEDANTPYTAPSITIGVAGALTTQNSGGTADGLFPGGTLDITAVSIDHGGVIAVPSGDISLTATSGGIALESGSEIFAQSTQYGPGGNILLETDSGLFDMKQGSLIDVSAPSAGNSGTISIIAPAEAALIAGALEGASTNGAGGSFTLDTLDLSGISTSSGDTGFSALNTILALGGFNNSLDVQARNGDLVVDASDVVRANSVILTADSGDLDVSGAIDVSGQIQGGSVELNAGGNLNILPNASINAEGTQSGGTIRLNAENGTINFFPNADLYVGATSGTANGDVYFRSRVIGGWDVLMNLKGNIHGAGSVTAEAFQVVAPSVAGVISAADLTTWHNALNNFMIFGAAIQNYELSQLNFVDSAPSVFTLIPGLEVRSPVSLTLSTPWDLTSWRFGADQVPGALTIRSAGDLTIAQDIYDDPTVMTRLNGDANGQTSWGLTLVSGALLGSADPTAVVAQTGPFQRGVNDLTIAGGKWVYSESAPVGLFSGGNIVVNVGGTPGYMISSTMSYNVATYSGQISISAGHDLDILGGAIQSAIGNIDVSANGDLNLINPSGGGLGAIRTTGESPGAWSMNYWTYGNGGNITIDVTGSVNGKANGDVYTVEGEGWDSYNMSGSNAKGWSANYVYNGNQLQLSNPTEGLATMAGGNLTVYAGGSFNCQAGTFAGVSAAGNMAANSSGNLTIFSQGDMQGRFLVANGSGELSTMGNFGTATEQPVMELLHATLGVSALGDIDAGAIVNPTIARPAGSSFNYSIPWDLQYAPDTSVSLNAITGNVSLYGTDPFYSNLASFVDQAINLLPPTVTISAGGDINLLADSYTLTPSATGQLSLTAGGDINGLAANNISASIIMSEMSPDAVYGPQSALSGTNGGGVTGGLGYDAAGILHAGDDQPIAINAGGDITDLWLFLPKEANVTAGGNIENIYYDSHNDNASDVTKIQAGGNIEFDSVASALSSNDNETGILMGGPGTLAVEAGDSINLGTSQGIQALGNAFNTLLSGTGCTLVVASGYSKDFSDTSADSSFFSSLQGDINQYAEDIAAGKNADALKIRADAEDLIAAFLANSTTSGSGDLNMTLSQISTLAGAAGIFILTNGNLNVGVTNITSGSSLTGGSGIYTAEGGDINIFANEDINVNESRIMTFFGGNITAWSDTGSINAGRGSNSAISASPPSIKAINGQAVLVFSPPAVGSGIRALTYTPGYGLPAPDEGDIYLYARQTIDAGEAGIAGGTVVLAAQQVLNANNISFSVGSLGVPVASSGLGGLTSLSGVGSVTQGIASAQAAVVNAADNGLGQGVAVADGFFSADIDVSVLSFFNPEDSNWKKKKN